MPAEIELKYSLTSAHTMEHMIKDELIQHYIKDPSSRAKAAPTIMTLRTGLCQA